jgi:MMP 1-O-methyltransferase
LSKVLTSVREYRQARKLSGEPILAESAIRLGFDVVRGRVRPDLARYVWLSAQVPGWTRGSDAVAMARASYSLPPDAVIVQIGSYLGSSAILLAGSRKLRESGVVHCIDPFDGSGDAFSEPIYLTALEDGTSLRGRFDAHIRGAGLSEWVVVHQGLDREFAPSWTLPIDLLCLSGDQSYPGARSAYGGWAPFLKAGGLLVVQNSGPGPLDGSHDGNRRLVFEEVKAPRYGDIHLVGSTTYARRSA